MNTENLTPTEDLLVDLLTARVRLGEQLWTVETRVRKSVESLNKRGVIDYKEGIVEHTLLIWFTADGYKKYITDSTYEVPMLRRLKPKTRQKVLDVTLNWQGTHID